MLRFLVCATSVLFCFIGFAQDLSLRTTKRFLAKNDTLIVHSKSINAHFFEVQLPNQTVLDSAFYDIDFKTSKLVFKKNMVLPKDSILITFFKYPEFLTKNYFVFDESKIVPNGATMTALYKLEKPINNKFVPFDGLNTSGSISRGITIGNNQNAVVNSALDLQVSGRLSEKVSIRASIQDSNIPLQQNGYSQRLDEFDQIFMELYSKKWNIRAGDLFLENRKSRFLNFNKKVQGLIANIDFGVPKNRTSVFASAALVRGQYAKTTFTGQEGNQGPYKLRGQSGELFVLIVSGSERVFVNGILLKRGENNDYIIDYNAGEIRFTSIFAINSEMRINVEYQFSDRSYNRFVAYTGATHQSAKWSLGGALYSENDSKNQPLQQSLTPNQVQNLVTAGDNIALMTASSAIEDAAAGNKILYKKTIINNIEVFEFSNNATDVLFNVRFTNVGNNFGNYKVLSTNAVGKIYQYIAPINGVLQGSYEPIVRLVAPTKIQIATIQGSFLPSEKTNFDFEVAISDNDKNLFSDLDDNDNKGIAAKTGFKQNFNFKGIKINFTNNYQFTQRHFASIERLFNIEFDRDWNLKNGAGNQSFLTSGLSIDLAENSFLNYQLEHLQFSENYNGIRHSAGGNYRSKKWNFVSNSSLLETNGNLLKSRFLRSSNQIKFHFKKNWLGTALRVEDNTEIIKLTKQLGGLSQRFSEYSTFVGRGDSTKVYVETGYIKRLNDSLQNNLVRRVNGSDAIYLKSKLIQNQQSNLAVYINFRNLAFTESVRKNQPSLNSRILYNSQFFKQLIQTNFAFETNSGTIAQQEFSYVEVDAGKGIYVWQDYNTNGILELEEFEIAQFSDQAKFIRVFLPNQIFVQTHQNKFSQAVILNFNQWQNKNGFRQIVSHFYNQTTFLTDRKILRKNQNFDLNPFSDNENTIGLSTNFRNSLFFNRGKQQHSVTYNLLANQNKNLLSVGSQTNNLLSHQLLYQHLIAKTWLVTVDGTKTDNQFLSENYVSRNYFLKNHSVQPKISYILSQMNSLDLFISIQKKSNLTAEQETLMQQKAGISFTYSSEKQFTINGEFVYVLNKFNGNSQSPVAFQMLEGLQPGVNATWRLLVQKKLSSFLDININYQGRKSDGPVAIQTGNVQLRAFF